MAFYTALGNNAEKKPTLLWTNPNPTSAFAQQTVPLDLSKYKSVCIKLKNKNVSTSNRVGYAFYSVGDTVTVPSAAGTAYPNVIGIVQGRESELAGVARNLSITSTGITFGTGYNSTGSGSNGSAIPLEIYGIEAQIYPDNP